MEKRPEFSLSQPVKLDYLQLITLALSAMEDISSYIIKLRQAAAQSGEWTSEQDAAFDAKLASLPDYWKRND